MIIHCLCLVGTLEDNVTALDCIGSLGPGRTNKKELFAPDPDWDHPELGSDKQEEEEEMIQLWGWVTACALLACWKTMLLLWNALDLLVLDMIVLKQQESTICC